jgi:hypothetical protein
MFISLPVPDRPGNFAVRCRERAVASSWLLSPISGEGWFLMVIHVLVHEHRDIYRRQRGGISYSNASRFALAKEVILNINSKLPLDSLSSALISSIFG